MIIKKMISAIDENNIKEFEILLKNKKFDPSMSDNHAIALASYYGHIEIVKLLLNDPRVDPSFDNNYAISLSYNYNDSNHVSYNNDNNNPYIVELLWKDERVKNTLKKDNLELYNKLKKMDTKIKINKF